MGEPILHKLPPQAIEAEEAILSAAMINAARDVVDLLSVDDFYRTSHRHIFKAIFDLVGRGSEVDLSLVVTELRNANKLGEVGGATYIARLIDTIPSSAAIKDHAAIIKAAAKKRTLIKICSETIQECYNGSGVNEIISKLDHKTSQIEQHAGTFKKIGDLLPERIEYWESLKNSPGTSGIPSGLNDVDRRFGGFQGSTLYLIGARPSMGKSALGMRFARGAARKNNPVLFISIEMSNNQIVTREISCASGVDGERFKTGDISQSQWNSIADASCIISEIPLWLDDCPTADIGSIKSKIRSFYKEHGKCLIIIDYLQYIKGVESERKDIEIGTITRGLKASTREHDIPVVLLAQLNRGVDARDDKRPRMSDLRGSGEIEQDADIVAFLYRDEVYNKDPNNPNKGIAELNVEKFRDGKTGPIYLSWIGHRTTFENLAREG